jgi:hypothetical protein
MVIAYLDLYVVYEEYGFRDFLFKKVADLTSQSFSYALYLFEAPEEGKVE